MSRDFDWETVKPYFDFDGDNSVQTINGSDGLLFTLNVYNINNTDAWIQLFDALSPSVGTPILSYLVPKGDETASGSLNLNFGKDGLVFTDSIKYACATTANGSSDPSIGLIVNATYANLTGS